MILETFYKSIFQKYPKISTDSRNIIPNSLFFALKGESFDGNNYAIKAIEQGAAYSIVDNPQLIHERLICVPNVLEFLQALANYHRNQFNIPVIAITGTNGKTTTKELIACVLSKKYVVTCTQGNFNNHIGVPLTLLTITNKTEIAIIEMGANHPKEIGFLASIAAPTYGVITNIGKAHLEGFGSFENVIATKTELYEYIAKHIGYVFMDFDNEILQSNSKYLTNIISYAFDNEKALYKGIHTEGTICAEFIFKTNSNQISVASQLFGAYNSKNMLTAAAIASYFDVDLSLIKEALESYNPTNNRSQFHKTDRNTLILDAYNANPTSMKAAVEHFGQVVTSSKCAILGEMYELGDVSFDEHSHMISLLLTLDISKIYLVGNWPKVESLNISYFINSSELQKYLMENPISDSLILVKGSRGVKLETVIPSL